MMRRTHVRLAAVMTLFCVACGTEPDEAGSDEASDVAVDVGTDTAASDVGGVAADTGSPADAGPAVDTGPLVLHQCATTADCAAFEDGNLCNGKLFCKVTAAGKRCVHKIGSVVQCPDAKDTVCATNTCVPETGKCEMAPAPKGTPCEDGDACTAASSCDGGTCKPVPGSSLCGCKVDADCDALTNANLCIGAWFCDKVALPFRCKLNDSKAVKCDTSKDGPCVATACEKKTGKCVAKPLKDGTPCDDGDPLTLGDACKKGAPVARGSSRRARPTPIATRRRTTTSATGCCSATRARGRAR